MMNYKKAKQMAVPSQNVEVDPRSKTTADGAFNNIPTGDKEKILKELAGKQEVTTHQFGLQEVI